MSLVEYKKKRDFTRTPEPGGIVKKSGIRSLAYVIQKHDASHLHYDFRLELDGTLKSWAVPKGPSLDPERKVLAVQVEDHPLDYGDFEGVIPKGQYGGGTVLLWDKGAWEPLGNPRAGLAQGKLHFILHGEKLKGEWSLVRMGGNAEAGGKNWLLMKIKDAQSGTHDILAQSPQSVKTNRSLDQISNDRDDVWDSTSTPDKNVSGGRKSRMPEKLAPQLALLAEHPPEGDQWLHEIKFDGYRLVSFIKDGNVTLRTRTGANWTSKFPPIAKAAASIHADSAILDGEAVILNEQGQTDFQALQEMFKSGETARLRYFVFDLPFLNGADLRDLPLTERKRLLKQLLDKTPSSSVINFSDHVRGAGQTIIQKACALGSEGIVSKRADAPYTSGRGHAWLKSKCTLRQEFVIVGYTLSSKRQGLRSLLLGYYDEANHLTYAGRVGTGFDRKTLEALIARLENNEQKAPPTAAPPPPRERRTARWVKPTLVCEVRFTGWTRDGYLRHPAFMGLRLDKPAKEVTRDTPIPADQEPELTAQSPSTPAIQLTHPDKLLYPQDKITKAGLVDYYQSVAPFILPHVIERPLALVRCPAGLASKCFFMRNWSPSLPQGIDKIRIGKGKDELHVMIHDLNGILSLVQISALEIHTWNCPASDIEHPDQLIFDLDPGPGVTWKQISTGARLLRELLKGAGLPTFLKTSGGKGLHITIPIAPTINWDQAKAFCKTIAQHAATQTDVFVTNMRKDLRNKKIYIDFQRNGRGATAIAPYGTRARPGAAISMPITWEQMDDIKSADHFTLKNVNKYLQHRTQDPWKDFSPARVDLSTLVSTPPKI